MAAPDNQQKSRQKPTSTEEIPVSHWADHAAEELIRRHPDKKTIVCASGISPSGVVHIGNFREVITVDFVVRSLRERGREVRFIYSWDDYDALRKVPANLPQKEMIEKNLRKPISEVPDPFGTEPSYASHFEKLFQGEITQLGVKPEYIYQNQMYKSCKYAQGIRTALENENAIIAILNESRTEPLEAGWTCVSVFCKTCGKDVTTVQKYVAPSFIHYSCKICKSTDQVLDFEKDEGVKLLWRVDWPMRWSRENVDFEPGGKDHSSTGGSYETGVKIVREVWKKEPPHYVQYDFVLAKGAGAKLSSSSGNLITVGEALEVYEPSLVRYLFASRKPNLDFTIAFDLDVMKAYDDFDRAERYAYGVEEGEERRINYERRIYEFASVEKPAAYGKMPAQFPFRHLCNILQIHQGDLAKTKAAYASAITTSVDETRFTSRATRAWKWITTFAPQEFKFALRAEGAEVAPAKHPAALADVVTLLESGKAEGMSEDELANAIFLSMKAHGLEAKVFFADVYQALIGKNAGPKLASFIQAIGTAKAASILKRALG